MSRRPSTVSSARSEAGDLLFDHDDVEVRFSLLEVVGRPQSSEPGADDRHVRARVLIERPAYGFGELGGKLIPPQHSGEAWVQSRRCMHH